LIQLWARSKAKGKVQIRSATRTDGTLLDSEKDITESFNNYFTSVFMREDQTRHTESTSAITREGDAVLSDLNIDMDAVIKSLSKLGHGPRQSITKVVNRDAKGDCVSATTVI